MKYRSLLATGTLFLCVSLAACCDDRSPVFTFEGSPAALEAAERAAREWDQCGAHITVTTEGGHAALTEAPTNDPEHSALTVVKGREVVRIQFEQVPETDTQSMLAHEFGHALGAWHEAIGIMAPRRARTANQRVTPEDCAALR